MEFSKHRRQGNKVTINVSMDGKPWGQLWTWDNTATERHPWHAKPLNGEHTTHGDLRKAKRHCRKL